VVVTVLVPVPPEARSDWLTGEMVYEQVPVWVTVNALPAAVTMPTRVVAVVLAATVKVTVPFPDPDAPPVTAIHVTLLAAVHAHPAAVVTVLVPVPPDATNDPLVGDIDHTQGALNENVLERRLALRPAGPTASTSVS
jgi:hypothetical protein